VHVSPAPQWSNNVLAAIDNRNYPHKGGTTVVNHLKIFVSRSLPCSTERHTMERNRRQCVKRARVYGLRENVQQCACKKA
jgi:hypothetical protein